jgi:hypothetical protein
VLPIIAFFGCIYQYWILKVMLLRRHSKPHKIGRTLDEYIRKLFPILLFLYSFGQFYFIKSLSKYKNWTVNVPLCISFIYLILPRSWLKACFTKNIKKVPNESTYASKIHEFEDNYKRWNFDHVNYSDFDPSYDLDDEINRLDDSVERIQEIMPKKQYIKRLSLVKLIKYGVDHDHNNTIWDPLIENQNNTTTIRRALSFVSKPPKMIEKLKIFEDRKDTDKNMSNYLVVIIHLESTLYSRSKTMRNKKKSVTYVCNFNF